MKVHIDEETGYLIVEDISDGIEIIPTKEYQSYVKQIQDLKEQNKELQNKFNDMASKLADTLSAQVEADRQREINDAKRIELISSLAESEREIGIAIGMFASRVGCKYKLAYAYWEAFEDWAIDNGLIDEIIENNHPKLITEDTNSEIK